MEIITDRDREGAARVARAWYHANREYAAARCAEYNAKPENKLKQRIRAKAWRENLSPERKEEIRIHRNEWARKRYFLKKQKENEKDRSN